MLVVLEKCAQMYFPNLVTYCIKELFNAERVTGICNVKASASSISKWKTRANRAN